jgi:hypothetical protein
LKDQKEKAAQAQEAKQNEFNEQKTKYDEAKSAMDGKKKALTDLEAQFAALPANVDA